MESLRKILWPGSKLNFSASHFSNSHFYGESTEVERSCSLATHELKLASTYVEDAQLGQHSNFDPSEKTLLLYRQYHQPAARVILCGVLLCHLSLAVLEEPAMPGCHVPYWVSMVLESCFLMFYCWRLHLIWGYTPRKAFRTDSKNIILATSLVLSFIDMVVYVGLRSNGLSAVRCSRALRPVLCACWPEVRSVRVALRTLRRALPAVMHVALLFCALLATAALMAYKMLGHKQLVLVSGRAYFTSYWDSLFDLYVLVTTANHPDIMMPAFNENVLYVTFFVAFMVLCYFIYMNVVLAVIYNSYKRHLKAEVLESFLSQQGQLRLAFDLLSHPADERLGGLAFVCKPRFRQLLRSLPEHRSPALMSVLFAVLDADGSGRLELPEFLRLSELLSVEVSEVQVQSTCLRHVTRSLPRFTRALARAVSSRWFQYMFDGLTLANAVVIGCSGADSWWDAPLEWTFLSCFLLEIALKLLTLGPQRFFRRAWNRFDFVVIGAAFLIGVAETILNEVRESRLSLDVLLVLRVLRLVKIVGSVKSFQMIVLTLGKILPSLRTYGGVIFVFYYMFAIVGMELFAGLVQGSGNSSASIGERNKNSSGRLAPFPMYCGNLKLADTDFWRQRYCNNNFNDVLHSFIVLFELTVVNQWHVLANGFSAVSHPTARLFFLFFHLFCVTLLLNVFTAFVLEVFLLEYSAKDGVMETQLEMKIHALGLSESRRRRQSCTVSHEELVMDDSSEDEHGGYYSASRAKSRGMPDRTSAYKRSRSADDGHIEDDTVPDQVEKADLTDSGNCGEEDVKAESPSSASDKPASEMGDSTSVQGIGSSLETSCSLTTPNPESNPFEKVDCNTFEEADSNLHEKPHNNLDDETDDNPVMKKACSPGLVQGCAAQPCSDAGCRYDVGVGRSPSIALLDTSVRFHLSKSVRSVEVLLQKLFRDELQKELRKAERRSKQRKSLTSVSL